MTARDLQSDIKKLIKALGWTQMRAADIVFYEKFESDAENELLKHRESFKKKLTRHSTPTEFLEDVRRILLEQREARRLNEFCPRHIPTGFLSEDLEQGMRGISAHIERAIKDARETDEAD